MNMKKYKSYSFAERCIETADIKREVGFFVYVLKKITSPLLSLFNIKSSRGYRAHRKSYYLQEF